MPRNLPLNPSLDEYQDMAMFTAKDLEAKMALIHGALGLTSDAGEFADVIKAHVIYGKPLDHPHAVEELGDVLWFLAYSARVLGMSLQEVARANIIKLSTRYPDKYSDEAAIARADKVVGAGMSVGINLDGK